MGDNSGSGDWQFCVQAEVAPGETLAVVGDCAELGQWRLQKAFDLQCGNEGSEISPPQCPEPWHVTSDDPCLQKYLARQRSPSERKNDHVPIPGLRFGALGWRAADGEYPSSETLGNAPPIQKNYSTG
jgi:Starch binding domain